MSRPLTYEEVKDLKRGDNLIIPKFYDFYESQNQDVYLYNYDPKTDMISVIYNIKGTSCALISSQIPKLVYIPENNDHFASIFYLCIHGRTSAQKISFKKRNKYCKVVHWYL